MRFIFILQKFCLTASEPLIIVININSVVYDVDGLVTDLAHEDINNCKNFFFRRHELMTQLLILLTAHVQHLREKASQRYNKPMRPLQF